MTMTNNPTIDGVSRELTEAMSYYFGRDEVANFKLYLRREFQSLDKPVEPAKCEHEFIYFGRSDLPRKCRHCNEPEPVERQENGVKQYEFRPSQYARQFIGLGMPSGNYVRAEDYNDQQSTIARLEARIAELESGRGEPVAWRFRVSSGGDWFTTTKQRVADLYRGTEDGGEVEPLFTAPPAPVAVVTDEQQAFANWTHEVIGMRGLAKVQRRDEMTVEQEKYAMKGWLARACLDATGALSTVHLDDLDPAQRLSLSRGEKVQQ